MTAAAWTATPSSTPTATASPTATLIPTPTPAPQASGKILFSVISNDRGVTIRALHSANPDGSNLRQLSSGEIARYPAEWSPDGSRLAYAMTLLPPGAGGTASSKNSGIYVMNEDGSNQRELATYLGVTGKIAWSRDGSMIYFGVTSTEGGHIYRVRPDGTEMSEIVTASPYNGQRFDLSPDGTRVVFNNGTTLDVINVDGTGRKTLLDQLQILDAAWSPDGKSIACGVLEPAKGGGSTRVIDAEGNEVALISIVPEAAGETIRWSPDGTRIAILTASGVAVVDSDGRHRVILPNSNNPPYVSGVRFVWSPDGHFILYSGQVTGEFHMYLIYSDGTGQRKIFDVPGQQIPLSWHS